MRTLLPMLIGLGIAVAAAGAAANPGRDAILAALAAEAKQADPAFSGFSAERGQVLYNGTRTQHDNAPVTRLRRKCNPSCSFPPHDP